MENDTQPVWKLTLKKKDNIFRPISRESRVFLYTLILAALINLITNVLGGASYWTLIIAPFLGFSAVCIYCYGQLHETCEEIISEKVDIKARREGVEQITIQKKCDIQDGLYNCQKKYFSYWSTRMRLCIAAAILLFFVTLCLNKTEMAKLRYEIDALKKDTVSKTSYESYRNSIGHQLAEIDNKAIKLIKNHKDFLQIKNHVTEIASGNKIILDKNITLTQQIEQLERKIGKDLEMAVTSLGTISKQQDEILTEQELMKKSLEVHRNSERVSVEASKIQSIKDK